MSQPGVILVNLGTPSAATPAAVRAFLQEFLSDRRVVDLPRWQWWPLLNGIILPLRARRVARLYQAIWLDSVSPLLHYSRELQGGLSERLAACQQAMPVELAMTYGAPSLATAWQRLKQQGVDEIWLLPLYPQYSATTTASVLDAWARVMREEPNVPSWSFCHDYHQAPGYIDALAEQIRAHWQRHGQGHLLMSFHGIPQRYAANGDPYPQQCQRTAQLLADALALNAADWSLSYQSRFGREPWLQPYTDQRLVALGQAGVSRLDVICPGFAVDCLETLEEIAEQGKTAYENAGGKAFFYIPALNSSPSHIQFLTELVAQRFASVKRG